MVRILLLDNEPAIPDITSSFLMHQKGFQIRTADSVKGAGLLLTQYLIDVKGKFLREILGVIQDMDFSDQREHKYFRVFSIGNRGVWQGSAV